MYEAAIKILTIISKFDYEAFIVGGYPRNKYLNLKSNDIDICTNAPLDIIKDNFQIIENNSIYGSNKIEFEGYYFEITEYRKDIYYENRYPDIIFVDTLKEDLERRDFIMNTLCIDKNGEYVDLLNSRKDIKNKVIRTIKNSDISVEEDPLRIIRAIRFSINLNFKIDESLQKSIIKYGFKIKKLSKKRIERELNQIKDKDKLNKMLEELDLKLYLK
mgnify:CR=1 FL=1